MPAPPGWTAQQRLEAKDEGYWLLQQDALAAALAEQDALAADLAEQNALAAATSAEALVVNGAEDEVSQDALQEEEGEEEEKVSDSEERTTVFGKNDALAYLRFITPTRSMRRMEEEEEEEEEEEKELDPVEEEEEGQEQELDSVEEEKEEGQENGLDPVEADEDETVSSETAMWIEAAQPSKSNV